jgi:hypothetical protein
MIIEPHCFGTLTFSKSGGFQRFPLVKRNGPRVTKQREHGITHMQRVEEKRHVSSNTGAVATTLREKLI